MKPPHHRQPGLALLEFALGVAVAGVLIALALNAVGRLQLLGDEARRVTIASNQAAASSTQMLRCELPSDRRPPRNPAASGTPFSRSCP